MQVYKIDTPIKVSEYLWWNETTKKIYKSTYSWLYLKYIDTRKKSPRKRYILWQIEYFVTLMKLS